MRRILAYRLGLLAIGLSWFSGSSHATIGGAVSSGIISAPDASPSESLAAQEIQRYVYLRTGRWLPRQPASAPFAARGDTIAVARKDRSLAQTLAADGGFAADLASLKPHQFLLRTLDQRGHRVLLLAGGDETATLYAAYRLAECLGVRFYLHGDVIPDEPVRFAIPRLNERHEPLFAVRGIQPFHDFPEGPDWWNADDYKAILAQLPKLRLNFFGLHTYPENGPNAEPTVWIGPASEMGEGARVRQSYPSSYQNTRRGNWGYSARKTGDFHLGTAAFFETDAFGGDVMRGFCPQPSTPDDANEVFNRAGLLLRDAFTFARALGIQTCVGTETPLTIPKQLQERLKAQNKDPKDPAVLREIYEGMFRRIAQTYPLDYFWFWTPESWTWEGTKDEQVRITTNDLTTAIAAARNVQSPFKLATCGWVLGPQQDRAMFDKMLPLDVAVSCINREVGNTPVDPAFAKVAGRSKWAIPWMEDDPGLTSPQLWAGRMRRDAADARRYGCDGLLGIHWRTRILGPAVSALAQAAWDQSAWIQTVPIPKEPTTQAGPDGGQIAAFTDHAIADTQDAPLYQTVRYNLKAYRLPVSNGVYRVTLKFCEPHYAAAGKRVFDVKLQGSPVIENLDIFARVGQNKALDFTFDRIEVTNGLIEITFVPRVEYPSIAAIAIEGANSTKKINCGGPVYKDYAADWPAVTPEKAAFPSTVDFYGDWALHQFGSQVAEPAAAIFTKIDGHLPRPSEWVKGPGGIKSDKQPWTAVRKAYAFVDELAALQPRVKGAGNRERFAYWLNNFQYLRAVAELKCLWGEYEQAMDNVKAEKDPLAQKKLAIQTALPLRLRMIQQVGQVYDHLLATVSNPGELGTVANWEQQILPDLLDKPGQELAQYLQTELSPQAQLSRTYHGPLRLIVPATRTLLAPREPLQLKVIILAEQSPREAALYWRPLGHGSFRQTPLTHVARGVYSVQLPGESITEAGLEYYLKVRLDQGKSVVYPATAPKQNQTVVVTPLNLTRLR